MVADDTEKRPLVLNANIPFHEDLQGVRYKKWFVIVVLYYVLLLYMYSYVLNIYVMNEYAYYTIMKQQYPNGIEESDEDASACTAKTSSKDYQQQLVVQKLQSQWSIYCTLVSNIPSIIVNITIVSYSDIYLAPLLGTMLKSVLCAFGMYFRLDMK